MALTDTDAGRGIVLLDPKGDLVADLLGRLPKAAGERLCLLDGTSRARPPCLNPLDGPPGEAHRIVENVVSIFSRVYAASWGPRSDDILRAGLLTLLTDPRRVDVPVLADLPRLLTSATARARTVARIDDPILAGFWEWYDNLSDAARAYVTAPLMNKLRGLLLRPFVRDALAGGPATIDMPALLDGGICLVRLAKSRLGTDTAALLGSLIVARVWQAATARATVAQSARRDATLYLDECHNFLSMPYDLADLLAEARGYRLSLVLAHQHLAQLPPDLAEAISANARTKVYFATSPEDARRLARHIAPRLTEHDLSHLDAFHTIIRPIVRNTEIPAFTAKTEKLPPSVPGRAAALRRAAAA